MKKVKKCTTQNKGKLFLLSRIYCKKKKQKDSDKKGF